MQAPLRVALIGPSKRSAYMYAPIIKALPEHVELVAVWGRSASSAKAFGERFGIPWYTDVSKLVGEQAPQIGVVSVSGAANGQVGLMAVESGLHVLLETPIAIELREADAIIQASVRNKVKIEVAEQFHRRPLEQIKLKLIASGLFGTVYSSFSDFAGHGYHGMSVMRSYLGFESRPLRVMGSVHQYALTPHKSQVRVVSAPRTEKQEHGLVEFEGDRVGVFHWTDVGYDSPLRWWRSGRFLAEKGMGITVGVGLDVREQLSVLAPGDEGPRFMTLERRWERVDGGALIAMIAHTGDPALPHVVWENPFRSALKGAGPQWHDDEIGVAGCLMSLVNAVRTDTAPSYGPLQARLDQELILALRQSAALGGQPVSLPLPVPVR